MSAGRASRDATDSLDIEQKNPADAGTRTERLLAVAIDRDAPARCAHAVPRGTSRIPLIVIADREWSRPHGGDAEAVATAIIEEANDYLAELGLWVMVQRFDEWDAPAFGSLAEMISTVAQQGLRVDRSQVVIALTAQSLPGRGDGQVSIEDRVIVVRHQPGQWSEAAVIAHEMGHLFGLQHREGTYMQARGFALSPTWSDCQRRAIRAVTGE